MLILHCLKLSLKPPLLLEEVVQGEECLLCRGGAGGAGVWQVVLKPKVTVVPHEECSQWPVPHLPEVSAGFQEPSHPDEAHVELALNPVPQLHHAPGDVAAHQGHQAAQALDLHPV